MAKQKTKTQTKTSSKPVSKKNDEKEFTIPLRRNYAKTPKYKRAKKSIKIIKEYLVRHMRVRDRDLKKIKIDKDLNEVIWSRGIKNPPFKIKVKATKEKDGTVLAELIEIPEKLKFKKLRLKKREKQAREILESKKTATEKLKEAATGKSKKPKPEEEEKTVEEKKDEEEKKKALVEAGKEMKKQAAKKAKHQTKKAKSAKPKRPKRQAMKK